MKTFSSPTGALVLGLLFGFGVSACTGRDARVDPLAMGGSSPDGGHHNEGDSGGFGGVTATGGSGPGTGGSAGGNGGHGAGGSLGSGGAVSTGGAGGLGSGGGGGGGGGGSGSGGNGGRGGSSSGGNGGGGGAQPRVTLQMNDVSVLFPLNPVADLTAAFLRASTVGPRGVLMPESIYEAVGHITGSTPPKVPLPGAEGQALYPDLYVVAVRLDPCFADIAPPLTGAGCQNQVRLILQELRPSSDGPSAFDSAIHLFYSVTRTELTEMAQSIAVLRLLSSRDRRLGALAPHPLIEKEGMSGPIAVGLKALILRTAGVQNLTRVATMSMRAGGFGWAFAAFDLTGTPPQVKAMAIPVLAPETSNQLFFRGFSPELEGVFTPAPRGADDFTALADVQRATTLSPAARLSAFKALVRVDNPRLRTPNNVDCVSCHLATPLSKLVAAEKFSLVEANDANAFRADGRFVTPEELTPTFHPAPGLGTTLNVHAFSYAGRAPGINQRTVNETASVVAYLNGLAAP